MMARDTDSLIKALDKVLSGNQTPFTWKQAIENYSSIDGDLVVTSGRGYAVTGCMFTLDQPPSEQYWNKEGLFEVGDAYVLAPSGTQITKNDYIIVGGSEYVVKTADMQFIQGTGAYVYMTLKRLD